MDDLPLVSAILPTFNRSGSHMHGIFLRQSIVSILSQTWPLMEVLIGTELPEPSPGGTAQTLLEAVRGDPRVKVVVQHANPKTGHGPTDNDLHRLARGKYCTRPLADDEVYSTHMVTKLVEALEARPECVLAYGDFEDIDANGVVLRERRRPDYDAALLLRECYVGICVLYRREAWEQVGGYGRMLAAEDWDMWKRMSALGPFVHVPEVLGQWRDWPGNLTSDVRRGGIAPGKVYG